MDYRWKKIEGITDLKGKKILVTGGTSFIGKYVTEYLASIGAKLYVLTRRDFEDRENVTFWKADLNDYACLCGYAGQEIFDAAIYLAARVPMTDGKKEDYYEAKQSTLDPLVNFSHCFLPNTKKLIFASSIDAIGMCHIREYDETVVLNCASPYGLAKYCGELYAKSMCAQNHVDCTILRFSQVYGPNEPILKIIPVLIETLCNDREFNLITSGKEKRKYLYVDDAVQAIIRSLMSTKFGTYNIAGKEMTSMNELIQLVERIWDKKLKLNLLKKMEGYDSVPSIQKAQNELGYEPEVSLERGLTLIRDAEK